MYGNPENLGPEIPRLPPLYRYWPRLRGRGGGHGNQPPLASRPPRLPDGSRDALGAMAPFQPRRGNVLYGLFGDFPGKKGQSRRRLPRGGIGIPLLRETLKRSEE